MTIREANSGDAADLARLTTELGYTSSEDLMSRRLARIASQPDQMVLVAIIGERIVGWLQAHVSVCLESGYVAEITGFIVEATARRHGVGRALVKRAEQWASESGVEALLVRSNVRRVESHDFYRALRFTSWKNQVVYRKAP